MRMALCAVAENMARADRRRHAGGTIDVKKCAGRFDINARRALVLKERVFGTVTSATLPI